MNKVILNANHLVINALTAIKNKNGSGNAEEGYYCDADRCRHR